MSPVRNISDIGRSGNRKPIQIWHAVPPSSEADYEFKIKTDTETISLKDLVIKGRVTDGVTTTIGDFELEILDPDKTIYDKISNFDELIMCADYGVATNVRFRGKIERKGYQDIHTIISGRSIAMVFADFPIIYNSDGPKAKSEILTEIIEANFPDIDTSDIETDLTTADVNYFEIPFTEIIAEICGVGYDFYLRHDYVAQYFIRGSRTNQTEAISETENHLNTEDNAEDTENTYTKVRLYGSDLEEIPIISTSNSDTSHTKGVEKILKIDDSSVITRDQANSYVGNKFEEVKDSKRIGTHTSLFLPTLQPGEKVFVFIPREDIPPAYYEIRNYTQTFDLQGEADRITTIQVKSERLTTAKIIKNRANFENKISSNINPLDMDFSLIYDFSTSEGVFDNVRRVFISSGKGGYYVIKTISGNTGTWTSPNVVFSPDNISKLEFRISGDSLAGIPPEGTKIEYSLDGGITFAPWGSKTVEVLAKGQLQIRVHFSSSETQVKAIGVLYSL